MIELSSDLPRAIWSTCGKCGIHHVIAFEGKTGTSPVACPGERDRKNDARLGLLPNDHEGWT